MNSLLSSLRAAAVAAIFVSFVDGSAVAATNLVTNGGFETGDFSGWTQSGNSGFTGINGGASANSGSFGAFFGPVGSPGFISQTLTTVIGASYQLDYALANFSGGTPNAFQISWGGNLVFSLSNAAAFPFSSASVVNLVATSTATTLQFGFQHNPSFWALDDVSVVQSSTIPGTPDSGSTVALLGLALTLVACVRRRLA
jgi:hypothetical protein